ncbi:unnamed protein product [Nippostrongylus brasiliensis]|uniref:diphosphoinositol-pentakisphosphate 1-kinase n=1 Tax=Nippostrongylus brasiliensis TaxID=27835 RepID=A0A0N4XIU7_NIPBR|nr:unnamed protein product [Nippostrongylus brasiliensis]
MSRVNDRYWKSILYGHFSGINRKVQLKYLKAREFRSGDNDEAQQQGPALMLILKWGGELTTAGNLQAEALGKLFRTLYPGIRRADGKSSPEDTQVCFRSGDTSNLSLWL